METQVRFNGGIASLVQGFIPLLRLPARQESNGRLASSSFPHCSLKLTAVPKQRQSLHDTAGRVEPVLHESYNIELQLLHCPQNERSVHNRGRRFATNVIFVGATTLICLISSALTEGWRKRERKVYVHMVSSCLLLRGDDSLAVEP